MSEQLLETEDHIEDQVEDQVDDQPEHEDQAEEPKSGHLSLEEYIAQGGDPDMYRGKKAFQQYHEIQQNLKSTREETKQLALTMNEVLANQKATLEAQSEAKLEKLRNELTKAHDDMDTKKVESIKDKMHKIEEKQVKEEKKQPTQVPQSHIEEVKDFREDNPEMDHSAPEYNKAIDNAVNDYMDKNYNPSMSDRDVRRLLKKALKTVKTNDKRFNQKQPKEALPTGSPSRKPKSANSNAGKIAKMDKSTKELYEYLQGTNKDAAEEFLATVEV